MENEEQEKLLEEKSNEENSTDKAASVKFSPLDKDNKKNMFEEEGNLDVIMDIPITISLEVGRNSISIKELLKLNQGSVIELDRNAGEPLDVLVNGTLVAHAEVVVVNEKFGIRLTDVVSISERMERLK